MEQHRLAAEDAARRPLSRDQAEELVITTITRHADSVLRLALRHSICADDAQDAYQRAVEIFLRHAHRLDPKRAPAWLHTVAKHEAMAVRRTRGRTMGSEEFDLDTFEARTSPSPEEQVLSFEHVTRSAEALQRLKPNEVRALWLKAAGNSYADVSSRTLTLRYHSHQNDPTPAATRTLTLKVTAGIGLAVTPRVAAKGKTIRLSGRLLGTPLPRVGKVLELQARTRGGAWVTFSTVRTSRTGSFTSQYTFRRGGPVTYELRIRSRASGDYPYELGTSRAVSVRVR